MGNSSSNPSKLGPSSPTSSSNTNSKNNPSTAHRRDASRQHPQFRPLDPTPEGRVQTGSPPLHHTYSLSPPRKPALKPQGASQAHTARGEFVMGNAQSGNAQSLDKQEKRKEQELDVQSSPVEVPLANSNARSHGRTRGPAHHYEPTSPLEDPDFVPPSNLNFPPRLPLRIQEEVYTPGSPIITPDDLANALNDHTEEGLPYQTSILSRTTLDDDEDVDILDSIDKGLTVPTFIEWKQPGDKVYVTGTFAGWSRKYRMKRNSETNNLSAALDIPPGTHHVKFIVDGDMQLSKDLPTAVDWANVLVNYIEVSADDIPSDSVASSAPNDVHPPMVLPSGVAKTDFQPDSYTQGQQEKGKEKEEAPTTISTKDILWGQRVPQYLLDLDRDPKSHRFQRAANHVQDIPPPPTLPLFLGKSILNAPMPMKDDSSVLLMPNHTVLNHVATSSIKNDVLATSVTTRYKRKYVTTIHYRATTDEDSEGYSK